MTLKKVFEQAKDVHVGAYIIYHKVAETSNQKAYADSEFKTTIDSDTLKDVFIKGCIVMSGQKIYTPIGYDGGVVISTDKTQFKPITLAPVDGE